MFLYVCLCMCVCMLHALVSVCVRERRMEREGDTVSTVTVCPSAFAFSCLFTRIPARSYDRIINNCKENTHADK